MIIHKLIRRYLKYRDDEGFYRLQAQDTLRWLKKSGIEPKGATVLDLGCGHGILGGELLKEGSRVTFTDKANNLLPEYDGVDFRTIDVDQDDIGKLGTFDLVLCSNVLEHIPRPALLIGSIDRLLKPGGKLYLSWTNWLSPWGGQDYSPFHYLGPRYGHLEYDRIIGHKRTHTPYISLFPTSIRSILKMVGQNTRLRITKIFPRYYPEFSIIVHIPVLREFLTWNCVIFAERLESEGVPQSGSPSNTVGFIRRLEMAISQSDNWFARFETRVAIAVLQLGAVPYRWLNKWGNRTLGYEVGKYSYGVPRVVFPDGKLKIGKYCSISWDVTVFLGGNHRVDWFALYPFSPHDRRWPEAEGIAEVFSTKGDVTIGNDVWIGSNVIIMSGLTIGDGAVIGTGSVVTKDVEPFTIVAGNPSRVVRKRFSDEVIAKLLEIGWWDWPEEKVRQNLRVLCSNDLEKLIEIS